MVTVSKDQLKQAIKLFQGAYKNFSITKELFDVWFGEVQAWEVSCFEKAVAECLSSCEYPPNLAELKKRYQALFAKREEAKGWFIAEYMTFLRMFPEYHIEGVAEMYAELTLPKCSTEGYLEGIEKGKRLRAKVKAGESPLEFLQRMKNEV